MNSNVRKKVGGSLGMGLSLLLSAAGVVALAVTLRRIDSANWLWPFSFAMLVWIIYGFGFVYALRWLRRYEQEERLLPQCESALSALAAQITADPDLLTAQTPANLMGTQFPYSVPLLRRRLEAMLRALQRGAPLLTMDSAGAEERHFPGPERTLRAFMDSVLNIGIAGTFLSIILTVSAHGVTAETLMAHIGPGLLSGLAGVLAAVALRLCHSALLEKQDALAEQTETLLADHFVRPLGREIVSPEDRLIASIQSSLTQQSAQATQQLNAHVATMQQTIVERLAAPISRLESHAGALSLHTQTLATQSGVWGETLVKLQEEHNRYLQAQQASQAQHEARLSALSVQLQTALEEFAKTVSVTQEEQQEKTQAFITSVQHRHATALTGLLDHLREELTSLLQQQEQANRKLREDTTAALSQAVEERVGAIEREVSSTLAAFATALPGTLRDGVREALAATVAMAEALREQAGILAHRVDQVSQNADRQLQAYEKWHDRGDSALTQLEAALKTGQTAQADLLQKWQAQATESLLGVQNALDATAQGVKRDYAALDETLRRFVAQVEALQTPAKGLLDQLQALPTPVRDLGAAMRQVSPTLVLLDKVVHDLSQTTETLRDREQAQTQQTREALQRLIQSVSAVAERINATTASQASSAGRTNNGHVS